MADLDSTLEAIYGYDIGFDNGTGLVDADANANGTDFNTPMGPLALREELERLFLTPLGSCIDDPTYGIDIDYLIGTQLDPRVSIGLARLAVLNALSHPSFASRFRIAELEATWTPEYPNAIFIYGVLECFGFSGAAFQFGPIALELARS